jgi:hypothetical protein
MKDMLGSELLRAAAGCKDQKQTWLLGAMETYLTLTQPNFALN